MAKGDILSDRRVRVIGTLFGTVVGVGVFGLPAVFGQAGFGVGILELLIIGVVMTVLFLMYSEITIQIKGKHRFVAYIEHFLGHLGGKIAALSILSSMFGALLAFLVIGGRFLSELTPLDQFYSTIVLACIVAVPVHLGMNFVSKLELVVISVMLFLYAVLMAFSLPAFSWSNLLPLYNGGWANTLAPYGVILFALSGFAAIPEMHDILGSNFKRLPKLLILGYGLIIIFYALFATVILGATGVQVTEDAITGIAVVVHPAIGVVGSLIGLVSVFSIFTILATELMQTIKIDLHLKHTSSWLLTMGLPLFLFLIGIRHFLGILGFVGSVFSGVSAMLIIIAYRKIENKKRKYVRLPWIVSIIVAAVFLFGMAIKIF